jgi:GNAT superfamily N-acetyltransferase
MAEGLQDKFAEIAAARPAVETMVAQLAEFGATAEPFGRAIDGIDYIVAFAFPEQGAHITLSITLQDYETGADLVINTMTTLPEEQQSKGLGSEVVRRLLEWAKRNKLRTIRAVQVMEPRSRKFWMKNGFAAVPRSTTSDFLFTLPESH